MKYIEKSLTIISRFTLIGVSLAAILLGFLSPLLAPQPVLAWDANLAQTFSMVIGAYGTGDGQVIHPEDVANAPNGYIYVADSDNDRIEIFDASGTFISAWGTTGTGDGQFDQPMGVEVDSSGNVYVADYYNNRIQKFDGNGVFITKWGTQGSGDTQLYRPSGVVVDPTGTHLYVADNYNCRIVRFSLGGEYELKWGSYGTGNSQFQYPYKVAVDSVGNVYVPDYTNARVQKFDADGVYITQWGTDGYANGQFKRPTGIAVDADDNIYVSDGTANRVDKFTSTGTYILRVASYGASDSHVIYPAGLSIDSHGNVFIADRSNSRIQKFSYPLELPTVTTVDPASSVSFTTATVSGTVSSDGGSEILNRGVVYSWEVEVPTDEDNTKPVNGTTGGFAADLVDLVPGKTYYARAYAVNSVGIAYGDVITFDTLAYTAPVVSTSPNMSGVTNAEANLIATVEDDGGSEILERGFVYSKSIAEPTLADSGSTSVDGTVGEYQDLVGGFNAMHYYVRAYATNAIGTTYGNVVDLYLQPTFVTSYGLNGSQEGQFKRPMGVAVTIDGAYFYVVDMNNNRIQKFTSDGTFDLQFGSLGSENGQFTAPRGIVVSPDGSVFVADTQNNRIQRFSALGEFTLKWGSGGSGDGEFNRPVGLALDSDGNVYVADSLNNRIQKFTSEGVFIDKWGTYGTNEGEFSAPEGVAIAPNGNIYVTDTGDHRIQVFNTAFEFVDEWGSLGSNPDEFNNPKGISIDSNGYVYIADVFNDRIQIYNSAGTFLVAFGTRGTDDGQFQTPRGVFVDAFGAIYVADTFTDRIVKFAYPFILPVVTTSTQVADISYTSATASGEVVTDSGYEIIERGFVYSSTETTPTVENSIKVNSGGTVGTFSVGLTGLTSHTTYHVRAVAISSQGVAYGDVVSFETLATTAPVVTTTGNVLNITTSGAAIPGEVTSDGGAAITERGIVYASSNPVPTKADHKRTAAGTIGTMLVTISGLANTTHYYARAYATNSVGTTFSDVMEFTTLTPTPIPTPTATATPTPTPSPTTTIPAALNNVYVTFAKFKYNKYTSPAALKSGDTAYIKNFSSSKLKLLQVFLYDYAKKGNQGYAKSQVTTTSMFLKTTSQLPTGKRYAYVFKFQDKATGIIATKYFVFYTTKTWLGKSVLGATTIGESEVLAEASETVTPTVTETVEPELTIPVTDLPPTTTTKAAEDATKQSSNYLLPILAVVGVGGVGLILVFRKS